MLKRIWLVIIFVQTFGYSQNYIKHTVAKGETILQIAQKYKVTPFDIYKLNPDSQNGIQLDSVLLIPKANTQSNSAIAKTHTVEPKETLYSISKLHQISIEQLENDNPIIKENGLQIGMVLQIAKQTTAINTVTVPKNNSVSTQIKHTVIAGETKYSLAKKYNISQEELEKQNPQIANGVYVGDTIFITKNKDSNVVVNQPVVVKEIKPISNTVVADKNLYDYTVKDGDTFYSLTNKFSITEEKLKALNPFLENGLQEGTILKIPVSISERNVKTNVLKDLTKSITKQSRKELVLFLPFNANKIQNDTTTSIQERLKKDKFLNLTLDFYSGALMAIDSAKILGLNVDVKIYDSQETKNSTSAISTIKNNNFSNTDAVIGPFYQANVEKVAEELQKKNIPVISPLSKETGGGSTNLFQSMPTNNEVKDAMFDYIKQKNGNIIAVIDPKNIAIKQYLQQNQSNVSFVNLNDKGAFVADSIKRHFVKDKINYVVLETEKSSTALTTTSAMINSLKDYQLQLVVLEENQVLEQEEIDTKRLTRLRLSYPTVSRTNTTTEAIKFEKKYRKKNGTLPNNFAIRGFDVTFDILLRMAQETPIVENLKTVATQQIENKFSYWQDKNGSYYNNGVFIEYYNTDLTIKQEP